MPKKTKYRKDHKRRKGGTATRTIKVSFGDYGLKTLDAHWITARQIESARRVLTRYVKKTGKIWIRIFPDKPVTVKGGEIPMGKGKGAVDHYVACIKPGTVMFEMNGIDEATAKDALLKAAMKLPVKCAFITKEETR